ncbi:uncharacterized protein BDR25DRAFT_318614 [Lindgomyces ingoldianus]|uniref:Uncharacterized protein n=1 Tax=Lindgomyces ingoldianus TaxID=673940 RepID=A0ACB6QEN2_9PLEO|nr:uncharacterized protein BDR25DRAFT_318614 [Lindgomyces ingoldianus]KAF2465376.1 hypothetical protein BDR25DRAFT_318614 [Lindgomyces ingoldianus]
MKRSAISPSTISPYMLFTSGPFDSLFHYTLHCTQIRRGASGDEIPIALGPQRVYRVCKGRLRYSLTLVKALRHWYSPGGGVDLETAAGIHPPLAGITGVDEVLDRQQAEAPVTGTRADNSLNANMLALIRGVAGMTLKSSRAKMRDSVTGDDETW